MKLNRAQRRELLKKGLWQVQVTDAQGRHIPVGPATSEKDAAENLCQEINVRVSLGKEKEWHDARVVAVKFISTEVEVV